MGVMMGRLINEIQRSKYLIDINETRLFRNCAEK